MVLKNYRVLHVRIGQFLPGCCAMCWKLPLFFPHCPSPSWVAFQLNEADGDLQQEIQRERGMTGVFILSAPSLQGPLGQQPPQIQPNSSQKGVFTQCLCPQVPEVSSRPSGLVGGEQDRIAPLSDTISNGVLHLALLRFLKQLLY